MNIYNAMAAPIIHGCEIQVGPPTTTTKKDMNEIQYAEYEILRSVNDCSRLDKTKNEEIRKQLYIESVRNTII